MGLFSAKKNHDADAPKQQQPERGGSAVRGLLVLGIVLLIVLPGYLVTLTPAVLAYERRRVRTGWYWLWALVTLILGIVLAGSVSAWQAWLLAWPGHMLPIAFHAGEPGSVPAMAAAFQSVSAAHAVLCQTIALAPIAMASCAVFTLARSFSRKTRGRIEGDDHSNERPVGILDRRRIIRERRRVAAARYSPALHIAEPTLDELHAQMAELDPNYVPPTTAAPTDDAPAKSLDAGDDSATTGPSNPSRAAFTSHLKTTYTTMRSAVHTRTRQPPPTPTDAVDLAPHPAGNPFSRNPIQPASNMVSAERSPVSAAPATENRPPAPVAADAANRVDGPATDTPQPDGDSPTMIAAVARDTAGPSAGAEPPPTAPPAADIEADTQPAPVPITQTMPQPDTADIDDHRELSDGSPTLVPRTRPPASPARSTADSIPVIPLGRTRKRHE